VTRRCAFAVPSLRGLHDVTKPGAWFVFRV
jgi:hypothetical protein